MPITITIKQGTRAEVTAAASSGALRAGEPYLITDEGRIAIGLSQTAFESFALLSELAGGATHSAALDGGSAYSVFLSQDTFDGGSALG